VTTLGRNDRRVVVAFKQVGRFWNILRDLKQVGVLVEVTDHLHRHLAALLVRLLQHAVECIRRDARKFQAHAHETPGFGEAQWRCAGSVNGLCDPVLNITDQNAVPFGERKWQCLCNNFRGQRSVACFLRCGFQHNRRSHPGF